MKSTAKSSINKDPESHPGYLSLELNGDWYTPKGKKLCLQCSLRTPWCFTGGQQQVWQQESKEDRK